MDKFEKQSQFAAGQIGVSSYMKGIYGKNLPYWAQKNKAKFTKGKSENV